MSLNKILTFVAIGMLLPIISVNQAGAEEQATQSTLTPAQARRTLSILQDDAKRTELEQTLRVIAQATAEAPPAKTSDEVSVPVTDSQRCADARR